jgi:hypothetical protein
MSVVSSLCFLPSRVFVALFLFVYALLVLSPSPTRAQSPSSHPPNGGSGSGRSPSGAGKLVNPRNLTAPPVKQPPAEAPFLQPRNYAEAKARAEIQPLGPKPQSSKPRVVQP